METFYYGDKTAKNFFFQPVDRHDLELMESEAKEVERLSNRRDFCIAAVLVDDWNHDLTPWKADPVFGKTGFGDGADDTFAEIAFRLVPQLLEKYGSPKRLFLCGYSLAGLFSLWSAYRVELFAGVAAVSPAVWYHDWIAYARQNEIKTQKVYLSLGDKEEKTKNPVMATVGDCIKQQYELLKRDGADCFFEWNSGNHFVDSDLRTAKGIAWLLKQYPS